MKKKGENNKNSKNSSTNVKENLQNLFCQVYAIES